jgi:DNA-binding MarR family transcriptional regulator
MTESSSARAANLLGALSLAVHERLRAATEGTDPLAGSEPAALVTLAHYPGQSIEELRRTLAITHSGAVRLVDRLERAGLVARAPGGPGRTLAIAPTDAGRAAAGAVLARRQVVLDEIVESLPSDEQAALTRLAERVLAELTGDRRSARHLCRLCDEAVCVRGADCPVDRAIR